jgi:23S rRNA pseudouridine1911/1915/1917 synthase
VHRVYMALAHGEVAWREVSIDAPIGRDPASRLRMAVVASGKPARTDVRRLAVLPGDRPALGFTALRCKLHSGRTHQIRVHMAHKGHPLVADALYGGKPALGMTRQALHAAELAFAHPIDGQTMSFECPLPPDLAAAWAQVVAD